MKTNEMDVEKIEGCGLGLISRSNLDAGEVILDCQPVCVVPTASTCVAGVVCCGCFRADLPVVRCKSCCAVSYCKPCDLTGDGVLHKDECDAMGRLIRGDEGLSMANQDLRLLLRLLYVRARSRLGNLPKTRKISEMCIEDDPIADVDALMSGLEGGDDGLLPEEAVSTLTNTAKQVRYLLSPWARCSLREVVRLGGVLHLNSFEVAAAHEGGSATGLGLYASAARMNHSCDPNAAVELLPGGALRVRSLRRIRAGEEVRISYLGDGGTLPQSTSSAATNIESLPALAAAATPTPSAPSVKPSRSSSRAKPTATPPTSASEPTGPPSKKARRSGGKAAVGKDQDSSGDVVRATPTGPTKSAGIERRERLRRQFAFECCCPKCLSGE